MFTGIVEEIGCVISMAKSSKLTLWDGSEGEGFVLVVECVICLDGCYIGASVSVNGTCLTVTQFDTKQVTFGVAPETLRLTNLGSLKQGSKVNMERAAETGGRNSGHYVQGHVDNTGEIIDKWQQDDSLWIKVKVPKQLILQIVHKGFIAIDGASLTVCEVNYEESWFTFMLVQYTQGKIIIPHKTTGELVNLEIDVLGKYVAQSLASIMKRVDSIEETLNAKIDGLINKIASLETK